MGDLIDLHTHSTASDGSMSPGELIKHAKEAGLKAVAITDHDTMDGVEEAVNAGVETGIEVIAGVEIGVEFETEMHILGYFLGKSYNNLRSTFVELRNNRDIRNPKIIEKLNELGFDISMEEILRAANGSVVGRPHIAKVLMDKGYVESISDAFEKYLSTGKPAYFPKDKLSPKQGINEILKAGGIPVLAHPRYLGLDCKQLERLLDVMTSYGLKGLEVYYVDNSEEETNIYKKLADKLGLASTGGSDFHGSFKPDIAIGTGRGNLRVPYELLSSLKSLS